MPLGNFSRQSEKLCMFASDVSRPICFVVISICALSKRDKSASHVTGSLGDSAKSHDQFW